MHDIQKFLFKSSLKSLKYWYEQLLYLFKVCIHALLTICRICTTCWKIIVIRAYLKNKNKNSFIIYPLMLWKLYIHVQVLQAKKYFRENFIVDNRIFRPFPLVWEDWVSKWRWHSNLINWEVFGGSYMLKVAMVLFKFLLPNECKWIYVWIILDYYQFMVDDFIFLIHCKM